MNIFSIRLAQHATFFTSERYFPSLTNQQKIIVLCCAAVFALFTLVWLIRRCWPAGNISSSRIQDSRAAAQQSQPIAKNSATKELDNQHIEEMLTAVDSTPPEKRSMPSDWDAQVTQISEKKRRKFYLKTIQSHPGFAPAYQHLASTLEVHEKIKLLDGKLMNEKELYLKAIQLDPAYAVAYHELGCSLAKDGIIRLPDGTDMTERQLYLKTIQLDPTFPEAYNNLAYTLEKGEVAILLDGTQLTEQELYLKTIDLDPACSDAFHNLSTTLQKKQSIKLLNGTTMTKAELVKNSKTL